MNKMNKIAAAALLAAFGTWMVAAPVSAAPILGFEGVTNNSVANTATGVAQLGVELGDLGTQVSFRFFNSGPLASSITDVYFDDGTLLGIASITGGSGGVSFSQGASPPNLPGGNSINFHTSAGFLADSDPPVQPNGVNPGEELTIVFNLLPGLTFADILNALQLSRDNPGVDVVDGLRIGIHVQGFAGGGSESFVNNGTRVPEPGTLGLLGLGLLALGLIAARRRSVA